MTENLKLAKNALSIGGATCIVAKNNQILHSLSGLGVKPLLSLYKNHPADLQGAAVADKVIGKAAAVILSLAGAGEVFGAVLSESGAAFLKKNAVPVYGGRLVPNISNRKGDGICPLEQSVACCDDCLEAYRSLLAKIDELMQNK